MRLRVTVVAAALAAALTLAAAGPALAHPGAHVIDPGGDSRVTHLLRGVPYDMQGPAGAVGEAEFAALSEPVRRVLAERIAQISVVQFAPEFGSHATTSAVPDRGEWTLVMGDAGSVDAECRIVGRPVEGGVPGEAVHRYRLSADGKSWRPVELGVLEVIVGPGPDVIVVHGPADNERIHAIYDPGPVPSIPGAIPGVRSCAHLANEGGAMPSSARTASSRPDGTVPDLIGIGFWDGVRVEHDAERPGGYHPRLGDLGERMRVIYCKSCPGSDPDSAHAVPGALRPAAVHDSPNEIVLSLEAREGGPQSPAHVADTGRFWGRYLVEWDAGEAGIFRAADIVPGVRNDESLGIREHLRRGATPLAPGATGLDSDAAPIEVEDALPPAPLLPHVVTGSTVIQVFSEEISEGSLGRLAVERTPPGIPGVTEEVPVSNAAVSGRTLTFTASGVGPDDHLEYFGIADLEGISPYRPEIFDLERVSDTQTVVSISPGVAGTTHASHWRVAPVGGLDRQVSGAVLGRPGMHAPGGAGVAESPWVTLTHEAIRGDARRGVAYYPPPHSSYEDRFEGRLASGGVRLNWQHADQVERGTSPPPITGLRFDGPETILVGLGRPVVAAPESVEVSKVISWGSIDWSRTLGRPVMAPVAERPTPDSPASTLTLSVPPAAAGSWHVVRLEPSTIVDVAGNDVYQGPFDVKYRAGPRVAAAQTVSATMTEVTIDGAHGHFGGSTLASDWALLESLNGADVRRVVKGVGHAGIGTTPAVEAWWPRLDIPPSLADGGRAVITLRHEALSSSEATPEVRYSAGIHRLGASDAFLSVVEAPTARLLRSTEAPHPVASDGAPVGLVSAVTAESDAGGGERSRHTVVTLSDPVEAVGSPTPAQAGSHWIVEDARGNYEVPEATIHGRKVLLRHSLDPAMAYIAAYSPTPSEVGRLSVPGSGPVGIGEVIALDGIPPRLEAVSLSPTSVIATFSEPVNAPAGPAALSILGGDGEPLHGHSVTSVIDDDEGKSLEFSVWPPLAHGTYALRVSGVEDDGRNAFGATVQAGLSAAPASFTASSEGGTTVVTLDVPVAGRLDTADWGITEDPDGFGPESPVALAVSSVSHMRADGTTVAATPGSPTAILAADATRTLAISHEPHSGARATVALSYAGASLADASGARVAPTPGAPVAALRDGVARG